jgi:hypothetical protein
LFARFEAAVSIQILPLIVKSAEAVWIPIIEISACEDLI